MHEIEKPSNQEEEYFAREEIEAKHKLALKQAAQMEEKAREELQRLHYMKCPKCGMDLHTLKKGPVDVDMCFHCQGVWLDAGEMEALTARGTHESGAVMKSVLNIFRKPAFWKRS